MVEITLPIVLQFLQTAGILVGIIYYITIMRNQQRTRELTLESQELARKAQEQTKETRQAQLLMQLYETYRSPEFRKNFQEVWDMEYTDFDDFWGKYGSQVNLEAWSNWQSVAAYFHGIGVLLKEGLIDVNLVDQLIVNLVLVSWLQMGPIVKGFREYSSGIDARFEGRGSSERHPILSGFEYLNNELRKREDAQQA